MTILRAVQVLATGLVGIGGLAPVVSAEGIFPGADENTPSQAHYFTWINNTNEGPTEAQTEANLAFFQWLHDEYGMVLDIYAFVRLMESCRKLTPLTLKKP